MKCATCKSDKPDMEFPKKHGKPTYSKCKECQRAYTRAWHKRNRVIKPDYVKERDARMRRANREYLDKYKEEHPCTDCNKYFPSYVMDFDHLRDKVANVSLLVNQRKLSRVLEEVAKCELVCANCHRVRTHRGAYING